MTDWKGEKLNLCLYGASHDSFVGAVLTGIPAGVKISRGNIERLLALRRPAGASYSTARCEKDQYSIIRGEKNGFTDGGALEVRIPNTDVRSRDYDDLKGIMRPGHADFAAVAKYGVSVDLRGGGIFSGRLTAPFCAVGGIAAGAAQCLGIKATAYLASVGGYKIASYGDEGFVIPSESGVFAASDEKRKAEAERIMSDAARAGDSVGGVVECVITGLPAGLGDAQFGSLESRISALAFGIPAVKAVEFGAGCAFGGALGSAVRDEWYYDGDRPVTRANFNGGINGGISNGMPVCFRLTIKPAPTFSMPFDTIDIINRRNIRVTPGGRHDACIAPRVVASAESAAYIAVSDAFTEAQWKKITDLKN